MTYLNPSYGGETPGGRNRRVGPVRFLGGTGLTGECQIIQRRDIWLCDACTDLSSVETWRPPEKKVRPSRSFSSGAPEPNRQCRHGSLN